MRNVSHWTVGGPRAGGRGIRAGYHTIWNPEGPNQPWIVPLRHKHPRNDLTHTHIHNHKPRTTFLSISSSTLNSTLRCLSFTYGSSTVPRFNLHGDTQRNIRQTIKHNHQNRQLKNCTNHRLAIDDIPFSKLSMWSDQMRLTKCDLDSGKLQSSLGQILFEEFALFLITAYESSFIVHSECDEFWPSHPLR